MKKVFVAGVVALVLFELAVVWFIMPLPGSQRMRSIDTAYALYQARWIVRSVCAVAIVAGALGGGLAQRRWRWTVTAGVLAAMAVAYAINFKMSADHMFLQPTVVRMEPAARNTVALDRLVVGIELNGQARAYPLQFIGYHHQVRDTLSGTELLVSYCTVCRTGRIFSPLVNGTSERFRLVGMDHFNAMFEDASTGSWWRQANGEAITGPLKGTTLTELPTVQVTLKQWLALHPASLVMQGDTIFAREYAKDYAYEKGTSRKKLTGTDTASWQDKSWVVGITANGKSKAYDWNRLRREGVVNDVVGGTPIVLALGPDSASYFAFERPDATTTFAIDGDSLVTPGGRYALNGRGNGRSLTAIAAAQEFWHSWRTFQPATERY